MRIALVHEDAVSPTRGGICRVYRHLAERLADRGHEVVLVARRIAGTRPLPWGRTVLVDGADFAAGATEAVRAAAPDVAECFSWGARLVEHAQDPDGLPVVVRCDLPAHLVGDRRAVEAERALARAASARIAISETVAHLAGETYGRPADTVIPHGVDLTAFRPLDRSAAASLATGRLLTPGRDGTFAPAGRLGGSSRLATLVESDKPSVLWIGKVTRAKGWDRLARLAEHLGDRANVIVALGHGIYEGDIGFARRPCVTVVQDVADEDMPLLYALADCLVSTSRHEGVGLAILEAAACGKRVLVPGDLPVAAEHRAAGIPLESYASLAEAAALVGRHAPDRPPWPPGRTWEANCEATLRVYESVLGRG